MPALEMVSLNVTQPNTGAAMAAVAGNSLTVRNSNHRVSLLAVSQLQQATAGFTRITSPLLHDAVVGINIIANASMGQVNLLREAQQLQPQDTLSVLRSGSNTSGDIETASLFIYYNDLPGADSRLIDSQELRHRGEDIYASLVTVTATSAGGYTGSVAINSTQDQFKANRDYAILGAALASTSTPSNGAIRLVGPDWGNLGVGIPVITTDQDMQNNWFSVLSNRSGRPCIPVLNSANKGQTFISLLANENGGATSISLVAVLLAPTGANRERRRANIHGSGRDSDSGRFCSKGKGCRR